MAITLTRLPGLADNRFRYNGAAHIQDNLSDPYAVWWDDNRHPIVTDGVDTFNLAGVAGNPLAQPVAEDGHNSIDVGVDQDGRLHVAGNMHADPMRYVRQTVVGDLTGWTDTRAPGDGATNITYPQFVMFAGSLRLFYRTGGSSSGIRWMQTWDGEAWDDPAEILDGTPGESPYTHHIAVRDGWMHLGFMWRETSSGDTNVDLAHMRTRDGVNWQTMAGDPVTLPVTPSTAPTIFGTVPGDGLLNTCGLDVAADGNPHLATHIYNDAKDASRILHSWWDGTAWQHVRLFDDWTAKLPLTSPDDGSVARPAVRCHGSRVLLVWKNRVDAPGSLWLSDITPGTTMRTGSILDVDLYAYEPTYDTNASTLRLLVTRARMSDETHPDYDAVDFARQPLAILEVDLGQVDAVLNGTVAVPSSLEDFTQPDESGRSVATIRRAVTWLGCDVTSGNIIAELPDLQGPVSRLLGADASASASTPIPLSGPGALGPAALQATEPGRTMLVAVVNDVPAWAGWVLTRVGGTGADLQLACVTPEGYFGRRWVRDHSFSQVDQSTIMSTLAKDAEVIGGNGQGMSFVHDIQPTGILRDATYVKSERALVLDRIQEMSRRLNGAEWTIDPEWANADHTAVQLVLRVASQIGAQSDAVFEVFDTQGASATSYTLTEDWSDGKGANWVVAYGEGHGTDQAESDPAIDQDALDAGWPIIEHHFQPSSSIRTKSVLNDHAKAELARLKSGTRTWKVVARWSEYPRYGIDFRMGDTVQLQLKGHRHPDGVTETARVVGWDLDLLAGTIEPMLEVV